MYTYRLALTLGDHAALPRRLYLLLLPFFASLLILPFRLRLDDGGGGGGGGGARLLGAVHDDGGFRVGRNGARRRGEGDFRSGDHGVRYGFHSGLGC